MTRKELAQYDGREGRRAYVAVNGTIYDFTDSPLWKNGNHANTHSAGCDLTEELQRAPHVRAVVERFPVVGRLEEEPAPAPKKSSLGLLIAAGIVVVGIVLYLLLK